MLYIQHYFESTNVLTTSTFLTVFTSQTGEYQAFIQLISKKLISALLLDYLFIYFRNCRQLEEMLSMIILWIVSFELTTKMVLHLFKMIHKQKILYAQNAY